MRILKRKLNHFIGECENCGTKHKAHFDRIGKQEGHIYGLKEVFQCECGEYHNSYAWSDEYMNSLKQTIKPKQTPRTFDHTQTDDTIRCGRCNSTQLHADKKGFSLGKALTGGVLIGGAGLLGGFAGKNKVMITCMNCGYKWQAGK